MFNDTNTTQELSTLNTLSTNFLAETSQNNFIIPVVMMVLSTLLYLGRQAFSRWENQTVGTGEASYTAWQNELSADDLAVDPTVITSTLPRSNSKESLMENSDASSVGSSASSTGSARLNEAVDPANAPILGQHKEHSHGLTCSHGPFGLAVQFAKAMTGKNHTNRIALPNNQDGGPVRS